MLFIPASGLPSWRRLATASLVLMAACGDNATGPTPSGFLDGTATDPGIAITISSSTRSLILFQAGAPAERREIALGASSQITPSGVAVQGTRAAIPLGNAASVAIVDLETGTPTRFFTFTDGNATGVAWVDENTLIVANQSTGVVGRIRLAQVGDAIAETVAVTEFPTSVVVSNGRVFVVSSNLDDAFQPVGNGVVSEIDPATLQVVRTFEVGSNPQFGALGPDGKLYVTNSGSFGMNDGSLSVINLVANTVEAAIPGFGDFPGPISIDMQGRAFISGFGVGTIVWSTVSGTFIRPPGNAVCAPLTVGNAPECRGASGAMIAPNGRLYQAFFGSASSNLPAQIFVYDGATLALVDSVAVPLGANGVEVRSFR